MWWRTNSRVTWGDVAIKGGFFQEGEFKGTRPMTKPRSEGGGLFAESSLHVYLELEQCTYRGGKDNATSCRVHRVIGHRETRHSKLVRTAIGLIVYPHAVQISAGREQIGNQSKLASRQAARATDLDLRLEDMQDMPDGESRTGSVHWSFSLWPVSST
ncbi:hypothetical protein BGZ61DRAFT_148859 [Ilyonectria robusta]|uniref:uncharacterized protein n=1 Tax=Ilyonectria robusta TaxID=1079257 RepID=UPI001E8ECD51|nr:uncharacterized protein BGZ61DRAFT_148859 [Ilyonectria robusta]KAH8661250.1 hypothetical protein BGZ61DRAFT_148859 [Ilyonectria robusta]